MRLPNTFCHPQIFCSIQVESKVNWPREKKKKIAYGRTQVQNHRHAVSVATKISFVEWLSIIYTFCVCTSIKACNFSLNRFVNIGFELRQLHLAYLSFPSRALRLMPPFINIAIYVVRKANIWGAFKYYITQRYLKNAKLVCFLNVQRIENFKINLIISDNENLKDRACFLLDLNWHTKNRNQNKSLNRRIFCRNQFKTVNVVRC